VFDSQYVDLQDQEQTIQGEWISRWQTLYDDTYSQESPTEDPNFNIIGWNSSYTGEPIPEEEMSEWVDHTVERILSLRPRRVLEIGCGTGLLLFRVAPHCEQYLGTELLPEGLDYVEEQLRDRRLERYSSQAHGR
jgi:tRNA G46 methylase TrmB